MSVVSPPPSRVLALALPRLPTDRTQRREGRGSSPSPIPAAAAPEPAGAAAAGLPRFEAPGSAHVAPATGAATGLAEIDAAARAMHQGALRLEQRRGAAGWIAQQGGDGAPRTGPAPRVVAGELRGAERLVAVDAVAAARGLVPGMGLADARAILPDLVVDRHDPEADRLLLEAVADWADRYTPLVALDPAAPSGGGLLLDVTGCAHLFGGERAMLDDALARLAAHGFEARGAIAPNAAAAHALAWFGTGAEVVTEALAPRLARAPVAALRLPAETVDGLARVGLVTVGALTERPRAPLVRRFGPLLARRLDELAGLLEAPLSPRRPSPALTAERRFAEPILSEADVATTALSLARGLAATLEARGEGVRLVELALFRIDGVVSRVTVGTGRPLRDPALLVSLFGERLAGLGTEIEAGFGFEIVRLSVIESQRDDPAQVDLGGGRAAAEDLDRLIDRLGARLGLARVARALPVDAHLPERASAFVPAAAAREEALGSGLAPVPGEPPERPARLLPRPEPIDAVAEVPDGPPIRFRWRRVLADVARVEGPERIAVPWWERSIAEPADAGLDPVPPPAPGAPEPGPAARAGFTRDYFRVEVIGGARLWLFREGLQGRETARPRWYVHGIFA